MTGSRPHVNRDPRGRGDLRPPDPRPSASPPAVLSLAFLLDATNYVSLCFPFLSFHMTAIELQGEQ